MHWSVIDRSIAGLRRAGCGRTLQQSTGEFGWPAARDSAAEASTPLGAGGGGTSSVSVAEPCQWRISGTHGERIVVNVSELRLASSDCVTDYLEVRDGHWYRSPLLGQLSSPTVDSSTLNVSTARVHLISYHIILFAKAPLIHSTGAVSPVTWVTCHPTQMNAPHCNPSQAGSPVLDLLDLLHLEG